MNPNGGFALLRISEEEIAALDRALVVLDRIAASDERALNALAAGTAALVQRLLVIAVAVGVAGNAV